MAWSSVVEAAGHRALIVVTHRRGCDAVDVTIDADSPDAGYAITLSSLEALELATRLIEHGRNAAAGSEHEQAFTEAAVRVSIG